jgi:hypothetical protein
MPDIEYVREKLAGGTPTSLGDTGLDASGNLLVHNGTVVATVYSTANPPPSTDTGALINGGTWTTDHSGNLRIYAGTWT